MPTPRRYPDRTMSNAERAALSRARRAAEDAARIAALHRIATDPAIRTIAAAREAARVALGEDAE